MAFSPATVTNFGEIIGIHESSEVNAVIDKLRGAIPLNTEYFQRAAYSLPVLKMDVAADGINAVVSIPGSPPQHVGKIGGGASGTIWRGAAGSVYKRTLNPTKGASKDVLEDIYRENYVEAFIQTVLQSDLTAGENVSQLGGMYRDASIRRRGMRRTRRRSSSGNSEFKLRRASSEPEDTALYYQMEFIPYTCHDYIKWLRAMGKITMAQIAPFFIQIGKALDHFDTTYGFRHCDLHPGNIMVTAGGEVKIIDFGRSCLSIDGTVYSKASNTCESFDLLILLMAIREFYYTAFEPNVQAAINYFLNDNTMGFNLWNILKMRHGMRPMQGLIFHYVYHASSMNLRNTDNGYPWGTNYGGRTLYDALMASEIVKKIKPSHFAAFWADPTGVHPLP